MTTEDFIIELFCKVDDLMPNAPKHSQAKLYPSEVVTLGMLFALKGVGNRAFYRWIKRDFRHLFPQLPERTRLFRLFNSHQRWIENFMAAPSMLGLVDSVANEMVVFCDPHFVKTGWNPTNLKPCKRGTWNSRMVIETVLSMLTTVCHFKKVGHRVWAYFQTRLGLTMALFNVLVQWHGLQPDEDGFVHLSIAEFSL